jgi:hypothetical protein
MGGRASELEARLGAWGEVEPVIGLDLAELLWAAWVEPRAWEGAPPWAAAMLGLGPGLWTGWEAGPSEAALRACLEVQRARAPAGSGVLWVLAPKCPLRLWFALGLGVREGWPQGFWWAPGGEGLCIVALEEVW